MPMKKPSTKSVKVIKGKNNPERPAPGKPRVVKGKKK